MFAVRPSTVEGSFSATAVPNMLQRHAHCKLDRKRIFLRTAERNPSTFESSLYSAALFSLHTPGFLKIGDPGDMALSVRERLTHATFQMGACALGVGLVGRMGEGARGD